MIFTKRCYNEAEMFQTAFLKLNQNSLAFSKRLSRGVALHDNMIGPAEKLETRPQTTNRRMSNQKAAETQAIQQQGVPILQASCLFA